MKKIILTLAIVLLTTFVFGQVVVPRDTTKKVFKNVLSIDANGLLQQFFNLNENSFFYSPYIIGYKRIFTSNALRIGIGGNYNSNNGSTNDTLKNERTYYNFNIGIGYERYAFLGKRWNLYFGADIIYNYYFNTSSWSYTSTTSRRQTETSYGYGISPLLGVQFKISSRLSLATETSYDITYNKTVSKDLNTPPNDFYDRTVKSIGIETFFHAPTAVIFRINI